MQLNTAVLKQKQLHMSWKFLGLDKFVRAEFALYFDNLERKLRLFVTKILYTCNTRYCVHKPSAVDPDWNHFLSLRFIERLKKASSIMRNLSYPLVMALLSLLTFTSIVMVGLNVVELIFDGKALPVENHVSSRDIVYYSCSTRLL